jgi:hypothetical protein
MECGPIGYGCLAPEAPDDVHLLQDLHALIQPSKTDGEFDGLPANALFISSLHPASPFILLNVSMGDQALLCSGHVVVLWSNLVGLHTCTLSGVMRNSPEEE